MTLFAVVSRFRAPNEGFICPQEDRAADGKERFTKGRHKKSGRS